MAISECASYCLDRLGFSFILLGSLQSDAIESRFGWFRQLSGANYYISIKQLLDSDRKIRAFSALKFSGLCISDIDNEIALNTTQVSNNVEDVNQIADDIAGHLNLTNDLSSSDANIAFYVAGSIARSIMNSRNCSSCKELLTTEESEDHEFQGDYSSYFDIADRGGLIVPTTSLFLLTLLCCQVQYEIELNSRLYALFISCTSQRKLFISLIDRVISRKLEFCSHCAAGHDIQTIIVKKAFNCLAKSFVNRMKNKQTFVDRQKRKISKLSSK